MRRHPQKWSAHSRCVLLHPERNVSFRTAAHAYASLFVDPDETFQAPSIETVVDAAFTPEAQTQNDFRRRYLW